MSKREKVFVGLSGGVDSSVAALRLLDDGYDVVGVFIKTWQPDFITCDWEKERLDAMRVAAHLDIPFLTCDAEESYRDGVAAYMIKEYESGRTPNPDVMCNKYVKFDTFLKFALQNGADKIATGHYAQVIKDSDNLYHLYRGVDTNKDQTYFLWTLTQEQLKHTLFPVGNSTKDVIRREAKSAGLLTSSKKDSQGVCFLGDINMKDFLSHYVKTEQGNILNGEGKVIGNHDGAIFYTIGQRHGFKINNKKTDSRPWFVIKKDIEENTITVSQTLASIQDNEVLLEDLNVISKPLPKALQAQFRYRQKAFNAILEQKEEARGILTVQDKVEAPSVGQSCVLYKNNECLGGSIIAHQI